MKNMWSHPDAIFLCKAVERICPKFGCHVALTGGCLYNEGPRKDCDLLFYRIRQQKTIDLPGLFAALAEIGLLKVSGFGWCVKAKYCGLPCDLLFPEEVHGVYLTKPTNVIP